MVENIRNQNQDNEWEDRVVEADEIRLLNKEFQEPLIGVYLGTKIVSGTYGESCLHVLRVVKDGMDYKLGIWGYHTMNQGFAQVVPGSKVKVIYVGERDVGKGNPMQIAKVLVAKGSPVKSVLTKNASISDDVPF